MNELGDTENRGNLIHPQSRCHFWRIVLEGERNVRKNSHGSYRVIALPERSTQLRTERPIKIEKFNHAEWTKGIFSEAVTVTGIGTAKFIYLAGIGAEDEKGPRGTVRHPGNFMEQCRYTYDKIKRVLAHHGADLGHAVKIVTYMTDLRYRIDMGKCIGEAWGKTPFPTNTLIGVAGLAFPEMILEVDVTAIISQ